VLEHAPILGSDVGIGARSDYLRNSRWCRCRGTPRFSVSVSEHALILGVGVGTRPGSRCRCRPGVLNTHVLAQVHFKFKGMWVKYMVFMENVRYKLIMHFLLTAAGSRYPFLSTAQVDPEC